MITKENRSLIIPVFILVGVGILMVYSSTALISIRQYGSGFHYLWNHLFTVFIGVMAMFIISKVDYQRLKPFVLFILIISFILVILVFVPGIGLSVNGARRWIRLWPTTFQPSELVKIAMVLFLAKYMSKNIHRMKSFRYGILIPLGVMIIFQSVIMLQPDFGGVMNIGILTIGLLFLGGARLSHVGALILLSVPVVYVLISSSAYRWKRITAFLDPWQDPMGSGFQLVQSFIAFGRGNIIGVGIGEGKQKLFFLPEIHTDFIFSLIGEELGLIGVLTVITLFIWLIMKGVGIAKQTDDPFSYYLALGLTIMIGVQALINFAVATGLMPTKGLPLPFISYGGSSLLINMIAVGVLINISGSNKKMEILGGVRRRR